MFYSDKPINNNREDMLNRSVFSEQLAKAILSYTSIDNFTVGLCGKWGSGKTSILNMVVEHINNLTNDYEKNEKPLIIHFNPWNYSDRSQLTFQFFQTILAKINVTSNSKSLKKVGDALQNYSSVLEFAELIPFAGKYIKPLKSLGISLGKSLTNIHENKESLEFQKNAVIKALSEQKQKLIVIIDDIDRLNNDQIRLIFQLVNSLAGFPNMIYLLSFDREIVARALGEEQNCNGEEYLEKIIQVPFEVPEPQMSLIHKFFFDKLEELLFDEIPCDNFEEEYWNSVFQHCVSPFIKGIRDVNRIINVYRFKYGLMHNETNCIDLLALTTFQICAPSIFKWIYDNEGGLVGSAYGLGTSGVEQNADKNSYLKKFENIYVNPEVMLEAIQTLFPKFAWKTGGYFYQTDTDDELRRKQKISCSDRFQLYFNLSLEDVMVTKQQIISSINDYDESHLKSYFSVLTSTGSLYAYVQELIAYLPDIPKDRLLMFLKILIFAQTNDENYEKRGLFKIASAYLCERCCWSIFKRLGCEEAKEKIISIIQSSNLDEFSVIVGMVLSVEYSYGRIGKNSDYNYRIVEENQLENIESEINDKLNLLMQDSNLLDAYLFRNIYFIWKHIDNDSLQQYLQDALKTSSNIPKYLDVNALYWQSGRMRGWDFREKSFSDGISIDKIYEQIISLKNTDDFSSLKIGEKEMAIAFYLWYNSERNDHSNISKEEVDKLIPDWEENRTGKIYYFE